MLFELWGANGATQILVPEALSMMLFILYLVAFGWLLWRQRDQLPAALTTRWPWLLGLSVTSLFAGWLVPLPFFSLEMSLHPFRLTPLLVAAALLHPLAAMLVGALTGVGMAVWLPGASAFAAFQLAICAGLAAWMMQSPYRGRFYRWLRFPLLAGPLALLSTHWLGLFAAFAEQSGSPLTALDIALRQLSQQLPPDLTAALIGGGVVLLVYRMLPPLRPALTHVPGPLERSLRGRLLGNFAAFSILTTLVLLTLVFQIATAVSRQLMVRQMAYNAEVAALGIPALSRELISLRDAFELGQPGSSAEIDAKMAQLSKMPSRYDAVGVIDISDGTVTVYGADTAVPPDTVFQSPALLDAAAALSDGSSEEVVADDEGLMVLAPMTADGRSNLVLVARLRPEAVSVLLLGLQGSDGRGQGAIFDAQGNVLAHTAAGTGLALPVLSAAPAAESMPDSYRLEVTADGARQLVYTLPVTDADWTVMVTMPYTAVLAQALGIGLPLLLVMAVMTGAAYGYLRLQTKSVAEPLGELVTASRMMAAGGSWTPTAQTRRADEIGQLESAFSQMQRAMKRQLNELSLLLAVGNEISTSLDLRQGMPAILRGALRGTTASGARAVVLNPSGGNPLTFGEGPAAAAMAALDRPLMNQLRHSADLILLTPAQIREALGLAADAEMPVPALLAIPLISRERFQGVLWLGYRQTRSPDMSERHLLQTLSLQAAVLVENARLFSSAEGGRRQLMAVLASSSDAVIVTDPTARVQLINPALEQIFDIRTAAVMNRPVQDVIPARALTDALTADADYISNLEIVTEDGRIFYANVAKIVSREGQAYGRVAVLHDITHLKQIDQMKSEAVRVAAHELRNPLTFMQGYVTMLPMAGDISDKQSYYLDKIQTGIDQMKELVNDVLDLSRIEAGIDFEQEDIDLTPLLTEIGRDYKHKALMMGIQLQVDVEGEVSRVRGDPKLLRRAIVNYLENGFKYAEGSGSMWLRAAQRNGRVIISVTDSGPGIPEEKQARLFERFYRVKQPGTEGKKGTGLGLAMVKTIAERHDGKVGCYSKQGQGATFFIELPTLSYVTNGRSHLN